MKMGQEIDHKARVQHFHRRAQRAEADLARAASEARFWASRFADVVRNRATIRRKLGRARAMLNQARRENESHLERIIRMGREFS